MWYEHFHPYGPSTLRLGRRYNRNRLETGLCTTEKKLSFFAAQKGSRAPAAMLDADVDARAPPHYSGRPEDDAPEPSAP